MCRNEICDRILFLGQRIISSTNVNQEIHSSTIISGTINLCRNDEQKEFSAERSTSSLARVRETIFTAAHMTNDLFHSLWLGYRITPHLFSST